VDHRHAIAFAAEWERNWNAPDLDALLSHFSEDVVFTSSAAPLASTVPLAGTL